MKKILPFIFPSVALLIVLFLLFRWYVMNTQRRGQINSNDLKTQVEELLPGSTFSTPTPGASGSTRPSFKPAAPDLKTVTLEPIASSSAVVESPQGSVRYSIQGQQLNFSVFADLPTLTTGQYQVWVQPSNEAQPAKAFVLSTEKGGYTGSSSLSVTQLPAEVIVSYEHTNTGKVGQTILKGQLEKP